VLFFLKSVAETSLDQGQRKLVVFPCVWLIEGVGRTSIFLATCLLCSPTPCATCGLFE